MFEFLKKKKRRPYGYDILEKALKDAVALKKLEQGTNAADYHHKCILHKIISDGVLSETRCHYKDGTPATAYSCNAEMVKYDLTKGQLPLITLRPIATKLAFNEMFWIYQDASNDLKLLREKYGIHWWDEWALKDDTIGACYGETVRRHDLMRKLLDGLVNNPFGRRHILSLWQNDDFEDSYALPPCCFMTMWNVRKGKYDEKLFLDMTLVQRSSDYAVSAAINEIQYVGLQYMVARHCGYTTGVFTHFMQNVHVYNRHLSAVVELCGREPILHEPKIWLNPNKKDFYSFTPEDIKVVDYPIDRIKAQNPQIATLKEEIAI